MDDKSLATRFHLYTGETAVFRCEPQWTFDVIKEQLWKKKRLSDRQKDYVFRLRFGEIFFADADKFSSCLRAHSLFDGVFSDEKQQLIEMSLIPKADVGDDIKRKTKLLQKWGLTQAQGVLNKLGAGRGSIWNERYFVLQDATLFYFGTEEEFKRGVPAHECVPMGVCEVSRQVSEARDNKRVFPFELKAAVVNKRDFVLAAKSEGDMETWIDAILLCNLRRTKAILHSCCEELRKRALTIPGLFRLAGNAHEVQQVKGEFDLGLSPDLQLLTDVHVMGSVVKAVLKDMQPPLLTWELYPEFMELCDLPQPKQLPKLQSLVKRLPISHRSLAQYLFSFLLEAAKNSDVNELTIPNLAILLAPSLLRPSQHTLQTSISHTRNVLVAVQLLLESYPVLFPEEKQFQRRLTPNTLSVTIEHKTQSTRDPKTQEKLTTWKHRLHEASEDWISNFTDKQNQLNRAWAGVLDKLDQGMPLTPALEASVELLIKEEEQWRSATLKQMAREITGMQPLVDSVKEAHTAWLHKVGEEGHAELGENTAALQQLWVVAMYNIQPEDAEEELALKEGEKVLVLDNSDTKGWWQGRKEDGTVGIFPYNFVRVL